MSTMAKSEEMYTPHGRLCRYERKVLIAIVVVVNGS